MSDKTVYCVVIDNCEAYEDAFSYTESIWDSRKAAIAHIVNDLGFEQTTVNKRKCYMRYEDGDDIRNLGQECAYINEFTLNKGDEHAVRRQKKIPSVANLSPDERAAYGLSVLMTMYDPEDIVCDSMFTKGDVTIVPYTPAPLDEDEEVHPKHAIIVDSGADSVSFCNNTLRIDFSDSVWKNLPEPTDELLEKVVRLTAERDRNPVCSLMSERTGYDDYGDRVTVFLGEDADGKELTYVINPKTFECHQE